MKAQVFRGVNNLSYEDIPMPELAADEVLVQVKLTVRSFLGRVIRLR